LESQPTGRKRSRQPEPQKKAFNEVFIRHRRHFVIGAVIFGIVLVFIGGFILLKSDNHVAAMEVEWTDNSGGTQSGVIYIELFEDKVPITAGNFRKLAEQGNYDDCAFHRIIDGFMIQGGDFTNGDGTGGRAAEYHKGYGDPDDPMTWVIPDEFHESLSNVRGTISMANAGPDTGGSQFFINQVNNTRLDYNKSPYTSKHAVFGKVLGDGMTIVDAIAKVTTTGPLNPVTIKSVTILTINEYLDIE